MLKNPLQETAAEDHHMAVQEGQLSRKHSLKCKSPSLHPSPVTRVWGLLAEAWRFWLVLWVWIREVSSPLFLTRGWNKVLYGPFLSHLRIPFHWAVQWHLKEPLVEVFDSVSWMENNSAKLLSSQSDGSHCRTFFSTAAYGKGNKVPQAANGGNEERVSDADGWDSRWRVPYEKQAEESWRKRQDLKEIQQRMKRGLLSEKKNLCIFFMCSRKSLQPRKPHHGLGAKGVGSDSWHWRRQAAEERWRFQSWRAFLEHWNPIPYIFQLEIPKHKAFCAYLYRLYCKISFIFPFILESI